VETVNRVWTEIYRSILPNTVIRDLEERELRAQKGEAAQSTSGRVTSEKKKGVGRLKLRVQVPKPKEKQVAHEGEEY